MKIIPKKINRYHELPLITNGFSLKKLERCLEDANRKLYSLLKIHRRLVNNRSDIDLKMGQCEAEIMVQEIRRDDFTTIIANRIEKDYHPHG